MFFSHPTVRHIALVCFLTGICAAAQSDLLLDKMPPETRLGKNEVEPAAKTVLSKMEKAYQNLHSAELGGHIEISLDFPGTSENTNQAFNSSFQAPNKFKHEMTNGLVLGSDGDKGFVYDRKAQSYTRFDFPMTKMPVDQMPPLVPHILQVRNPSLLFAMSETPFSELAENFDEVKKLEDVKVNGTNYTKLQFGSGKSSGQITMLVDQQTQLIRRFTVDFKPALEEAGKKSVNSAMLLVDYSSVHPNASISDEIFDWTPPEESVDIHEAAGAARKQKEKEANVHLEGTIAPNFTLMSLDGEVVSLYELRGKVVVLDFWATWCGPCIQSLPHFARMARDEHDSEVVFFSINLQEDKEKIGAFLKKQKLNLSVLLDENGNTAKLFGIKTIPQTVIIGKDGVVTKDISGYSPGTERELKAAIDEAKKISKE